MRTAAPADGTLYGTEIQKCWPEIIGATGWRCTATGGLHRDAVLHCEPTATKTQSSPPGPISADLIAKRHELHGDVSYLDLHQPWLARLALNPPAR